MESNTSFDLLICGGGVYGAWTAFDAALRGLKVAIVDKGDWANGTSSASSKLVHGGLRYLETFDFKLVKKALAERKLLLHIAPHRVWPLRFGVPIFAEGRLDRFRLKAGLALYDWLATDLPDLHRHRYHSQTEFLTRFPGLTASGLRCGFSYLDAQTDDARLVIELIDGASKAGAVCLSYCEVTRLLKNNGRVAGAVVQDRINNTEQTIQANCIVDATGRWSAIVQDQKPDYRLSKGVHLILPPLLKDEALLATARSDGRVFFIIPWYGLTLVGTTDTAFEGNPDDVNVAGADVAYLLAETNRLFPDRKWQESDILGCFAGLRVLPNIERDNLSSLSRDWRLQEGSDGVLTSVGGKLTSAREDAAIIVDRVCRQLGVDIPCKTESTPLPWLTDGNFNKLLSDCISRGKHLHIDETSMNWLVRRHGQRVETILSLCEQKPALAQKIKPHLPFLRAEIIFCAQNERVFHLDDLLRRRIPLLISAKLTHEEIADYALLAGEVLGWNKTRQQEEIHRCLPLMEKPA